MQNTPNANDCSSNEEQKLNILINENTKHCIYSNSNADKIQCALEYNYHLIKLLSDNQGQLTQECFADLTDKLENNLVYLARNCDSFRKRFKLKTETPNADSGNEGKQLQGRNEGKEVIVVEDSISNNLRRSKRKEKEVKEQNINANANSNNNNGDINNEYTGITITIRKSDMSILN